MFDRIPDPIERHVLDIFARRTGYSSASLRLDADLEAELGIDSITRTSILGELAALLGSAGADWIGVPCDTLAEVVELVREHATDPSDRDRVVGIFAARTQHPIERLRLDADLERDLGIDSITRATILAEVADAFDLDDPDFLAHPFETIGEILDHLGAGRQGPARGAPTHVVAAVPVPEVPAPPAPRRPESDLSNGPVAGSVRDALASIGLPADGGRSFSLQGIPVREQRELLERVRREMALPDQLNLADCDSFEKVAAFARAASLQRVHPAGEALEVPAAAADPDDRRTMQDFLEDRDPDLFAKARRFSSFYRDRRSRDLYWYGMPSEGQSAARSVVYDEIAGRRREFVNMASNNYLGLANHPRVIEAIRSAVLECGSTNTGSRIIGGTHQLHKALERRLARFKGTEDAIVFPSGYSANLGAISALARSADAVISDKHNHMSIVDGCKLSGARMRIYAHDDMADLERVLERTRHEARGLLIVTDGVFSMHGDVCNLPEIVRLARAHGARVLVDDAHSTGVLGRTGAGTSEHYGMKGEVDLELGTFSKTLAGVGGYVCAREEVVDYLRFYANSYVFAAAFPAHVAAGLIASIDVMESEPERLGRLWSNVTAFKARLVELGFRIGTSASAIVPLLIGDYDLALRMGRAVRRRGLFCQTVVFPGVSRGEERLRLSISSEHTSEDLDLAAEILREAGRESGYGEGLPV